MTKTIHCVWLQHGGEAAWALGVSDILAQGNIQSHFVCFMDEIHQLYRKHNKDSFYFSKIFDDAYALSDNDIIALERKYGPPALDTMIASDVHLRLLFGDALPIKRQMFARALKFWENYFALNDVHLLLSRDRASLLTRSAHQVAAHHPEKLFLQFGIGPDDEHMAFYDTGTQLSWSGLDLALAERRDVPEIRRQEIDAFIHRRVPPLKEGAMNVKMQPLSFKGRIAQWYFDNREDRRIAKSNPMERATVLLKRHLRDQRNGWRLARRGFTYEHPCDEPYVYLPLFHTDESAHLINIRHWCRTLPEMIRHISEALPIDHRLYVKEHPVILGDLNRKQIDEIQAIPKVRVIEPSVQSQRLTRNAQAVISTEGTAGWEAFLMRKPLVVIGATPFYAHSNLIYRVNDLYDLETQLFKALSVGESRYLDCIDEWYRFIDACLSSTFSGVTETYEYPHITDTGLANIECIANAITNRYARHQQERMKVES